ncbi:MAG: glutathione S-transferase family protein [Myxococcota bacterium]
MRFYDLPRSPWCQMVRVVLAEKGLPHERHIVLPGQEYESWFLGISPMGRLPVLVEPDVVVREPAVINEYLEEAYPDRSLLPPSYVERARVRMLVSMVQESIGAPLDELYQITCIEENDHDGLAEDLRAEIVEGLDLLEEEFERGAAFAAGDLFTLADASLAPFLLGMVEEVDMADALDEYEVIRGYLSRLAGRASTAVVRQGWREWNDMVTSLEMSDGG